MEDKRTEQYRQELKKFVMSHTEDVLKNPRSFIRYPFIDPGSVYDGNVWDWDTYWSVYGFLNLADSYQDPSVKPRIIEHAQGNIRNFFDHQLVHQAYGYEYQLPNITAYNETCASLGGVFWAYRMFQLEPKAEYFDILERMMLNTNLAALSLDGKRFFY